MTFAAGVLALFDILVTQIYSGPVNFVLLISHFISLVDTQGARTHELQCRNMFFVAATISGQCL